MDNIAILTAILTLVSGIGIFLIACSMMSSNLEAAGSEKLKKMFAKTSGSRLLGVGIGTVGTAAIQSSGATTVMVIGFVNAGVMTLSQAAAIIYGANIGTTVTGQIVALGVFGSNTVSTTVIFSAFAGVGAFLLSFSKKPSVKTAGGIIAGFGMLFVGLSMMSSSMESFAMLDEVKAFLAGINNAVMLVLVGALLTAIVQSSSVMTSVAIVMVVSGLITLDQGIFLTMGSNIGSCVVALIAGITGGRNAKRTALIHLIFNVSGVIIFLLISLIISICSGGRVSLGTGFETAFPGAPQTQLAMFHTVFNVITVVIVIPLTNILVRLVTRIIPDKSDEVKPDKELKLYHIDENMLSSPPIAVAQLKKEIVGMAHIAMDNFSRSLNIICTLDFSESEKFKASECELNYMNHEIVTFLVKLSEQKLSERDHAYVSGAFHSVSDLERVGDYAENIVEYAEGLRSTGESFSTEAICEIATVEDRIKLLFDHVMKAYIDSDIAELNEAERIEDTVDDLTNEMTASHIRRLGEGVCTPTVGARYISLASNAERVADHFINVAETVKR